MAAARRREARAGAGAEERRHRRRARRVRRGGARRDAARDGRRAQHRVARRDPRRDPLGEGRPASRGEGDAFMRFIFLLFSALSAFSAAAQEPPYPQKGPIEITVLFPAGSSADVTARMLADGISRHLNQRVLVVNRPGAGGAIGYKHVASQKPDGYSLVWNSNSISTSYHSGQLAFDYQ